MKKILLLLLLLSVFLNLYACKNAGEPPASDSDALTPRESDLQLESSAPETSVSASPQERVLLDNDLCRFEVTGFEEEAEAGFKLKVLIENKSAEPLTLTLEDASVNGYMCSPYWSQLVEAKSELESEIHWYASDLQLNSVRRVRMLGFALCASGDNPDEHLFEESLSVFPQGDSVETLALEPRPEVLGERVLADNDKIFFSITDFDVESAFQYAISVYVENKTDVNYFVTIDNVLVNGQDCDPYWATSLPSGKRSNVIISWLDFGAYNFSQVTDLSFRLKIYDADDPPAPPLYIKEISVDNIK